MVLPEENSQPGGLPNYSHSIRQEWKPLTEEVNGFLAELRR
jgi:hypothetical protein